MADEPENVLRIIGPVGIVRDAAALVSRDLILVDDPFERRTIAEAVFERFSRDTAEGEELVVDERGFVLAQFHLRDEVVEFLAGFLSFGERIFGLLLVVDVNIGKPPSRVN